MFGTSDLRSLLRSAYFMALMQMRNFCVRSAVVDQLGATVVSLTSYGPRLGHVHLAIESIARGGSQPCRLILWLSEDSRNHPLSSSIRRLQKRGLEVRFVEDVGSHKKYWPLAMSGENLNQAVVIADDDVVYPTYWLLRLECEYAKGRADVIAHRAARIAIDGRGNPVPYADWKHAAPAETSSRVLPTGMGGVLYSPAALEAVRRNGERFKEVAPRADDLWLHFCVVSAGFRPLQVDSTRRRDFIDVRGTGSQTLTESNVGGGGNDVVFAELYRSSVYRDALIEGAPGD